MADLNVTPAGARDHLVEALLHPRNIVIFGASEKPGNWAQRVWRNIHRYGFPGPVFPINPGRSEVWGTTCYGAAAELPETPDHAVVLVPAPATAAVLEEVARAGARSATVMTAGFEESTEPGADAMTKRVRDIIRDTGLAVSGPNCLGNMNAHVRLMTMPDDRAQRMAVGPVAIVGQSGGVAMAVKRTLEERGTDSSFVVTSGNQAGLTMADYISYFASRGDVAAIFSYLEAIDDAPAFLAACQRAKAAGIPVVAMKLGTSEAGRSAALAHTGALAGSMQAFDAVAGEAGVIRVPNLDIAVETIEYFVHARPPRGRRVGAITLSGAMRGIMIDGAEAEGLSFPALAPETVATLRGILTVGSIIGNPLDAGFAALSKPGAFIRTVEALAADPNVDVLLLQEEIPRTDSTPRKEENIREVDALAARLDKPVAFLSMISHGLTDYSREFRRTVPNVAFLQEVERTMRTMRGVVDFSARTREAAPRPAPRPPGDLAAELAALAGTLDEARSKALLARYGIAAPREAVVHGADAAVAAAEAIGFPVVAKAVSPDLPHKTEIGAVRLGLADAAAVRAAYEAIVAAVAAQPGPPRLDGVLIAQQVTGGLELILGMSRDPEVGPVVMFGSGGVEVELHRDVAVAPLPLDAAGAAALIARTRAGRIIAGYRGRPPLDRDAVVAALVALSDLVGDAGDRIASIDVNPFVVRELGGVALDALVVLEPH